MKYVKINLEVKLPNDIDEDLFLRHRKECYYGMPMREPMGS